MSQTVIATATYQTTYKEIMCEFKLSSGFYWDWGEANLPDYDDLNTNYFDWRSGSSSENDRTIWYDIIKWPNRYPLTLDVCRFTFKPLNVKKIVRCRFNAYNNVTLTIVDQ